MSWTIELGPCQSSLSTRLCRHLSQTARPLARPDRGHSRPIHQGCHWHQDAWQSRGSYCNSKRRGCRLLVQQWARLGRICMSMWWCSCVRGWQPERSEWRGFLPGTLVLNDAVLIYLSFDWPWSLYTISDRSSILSNFFHSILLT